MQFNVSFTETALSIFFAVLSLALSCWLARYPSKTGTGVTLGVLLGVFLINVTAGLVAFLGYVLPFGQIDFWLASSLAQILR
ncbi:hypothetical protein [Agrobacterium tumefaciens]|uniref:Uncharacterized protein n=1 Tax=Agrobacterium tumefaciens TaxID=358 RepID=A0A546XVV6_AGRTU|nr:hypothetical protein [Agrobacterium tumefaciens]NSX91868.1 hypothetical protein [Agrobacterium tumefaciens]NTE57664.1 hypothetical protein [Agrobacterium tumefaciens]NTE72238.1 hypothetical protein [Agrobacterium tumefaciens]TRB04878.1 hypothetical protein EXN61_18300 [Agrobacterium tumefaciens]UXT50000.1 hypothetical protein FY136_12380 [Agrobacterium tumefaciens]